ncbi:hypothetical protein G6F69_008612 [Rhizopus microsporus]|nr:hypothetical protein G6F69_008612 [Rhizopus microsporus]
MKLCHPKAMLTKKNKQVSQEIKGALMCVNPKCMAVKSGRSTKSRDALSSLAIGLSGLAQCLIGSPLPPFAQFQISQFNTDTVNKLSWSFVSARDHLTSTLCAHTIVVPYEGLFVMVYCLFKRCLNGDNKRQVSVSIRALLPPRSLPILTLFHNVKSDNSRAALRLLQSRQKNADGEEKYRIDVMDEYKQPITDTQLRQVASYLGSKTPWKDMLLPEASQIIDNAQDAFKIIKDKPEVLRCPIVVDWERGRAASGIKGLEDIERLINERK